MPQSKDLLRLSMPLALVGLALLASTTHKGAAQQSGAATRYSVTITEVPPFDERGGPDRTSPIAGTANDGPSCADCRIVLFAKTNTWYVQPYIRSPYTAISRGRWRNISHLGSEYAALLVHKSYRPPATADDLPSVGGEILAVDIRKGRS